MRFRRPSATTVVAFIAGIIVATAGTAGAAHLITGKQIKNGSITQADLSKQIRAQLKKAGTPGPRGAVGATGAAGKDGTAMQKVVDGPIRSDAVDPPVGEGTLVVGSRTITVKTDGLYDLFLGAWTGTSCTLAANCVFTAGLYVDGQPVPGSGMRDPDDAGDSVACTGSPSPTTEASLTGRAGLFPLTAGTHTLEVRARVTAGEGTLSGCPIKPQLQFEGPFAS